MRIDVNALLNMMIQRFLGRVQVEAQVFEEMWTRSEEGHNLLKKWKADHPRRKRAEFFPEFVKHLMGEPSEVDGYGRKPSRRKSKDAASEADGPVTIITEPAPVPPPLPSGDAD